MMASDDITDVPDNKQCLNTGSASPIVFHATGQEGFRVQQPKEHKIRNNERLM